VVPVAALLALAAVSGFSPIRAQSGAAGMSDGVYTADQAAAGAALYAADCSVCHAANLRGGAYPALIGPAFVAQWTGEPAADTYAAMSTRMPQGAPGSLKPAEYLALMAYILQQNHYPAGSAPLTQDRLASIMVVLQH
jgi:mono/diheme cytochrome c family protein